MVKPQLIEYIQQQFDQGFSTDAVVEALLNQGWEPDEIQQALEYFEFTDTAQEDTPIAEAFTAVFNKIPEDKKLPAVLLAVAVFLLIIILFFASLPEFKAFDTDAVQTTTSTVSNQPVSVTNNPLSQQNFDEVRNIEQTNE